MSLQTFMQLLGLQSQVGAPPSHQGMPSAPQGAPQQQMPPVVPVYNSSNPLSQGSMAAINASTQSMGGRKTGIVPGLLDLAENLSISHLRSSDRAQAQALGNHFRTPQERDAAQESKNMQMMKFMQANEKMKEEQAYKNAMLEEKRRSNDIHGKTQGAHADYYRAMAGKTRGESQVNEKNERLQSIAPGAISYSGRTAAERSAFTKELRERANKPASEIKVLNSLDKINKIVSDYPDLSTSAAAAMFPGKYEGGVIDTAKLNAMPREKRIALEKLTKLSNDLVLKQIHGLGGQRASIFLEKIMQSSNPHYGLTPEAISAIRDNFKEDYDKNLADSKMARKALHGNYYVPMMEPEYVEAWNEDASQNSASSGAPDLSKMSNEEKIELSRKLGIIN